MTRSIFAMAIVALSITVPTRAFADSIVVFMTDCYPASACPSTFGGPQSAWHVDVEGGVANVRVSSGVLPFAFNAIGFNLLGSADGLTIDIHTPEYSFGGSDEPIGQFGGFDYVFDAPFFNPAALPGDLEFTLSRASGFASVMDLFGQNAAGYYLASNGFNFEAPGTYFVAANNLGGQLTPVPEPGSMLLLGSGLALAWRSRRRATARSVAVDRNYPPTTARSSGP